MNFKVNKLKYKKLLNARDLGGTPTADGRKIKCGRLIRSGRLYNLPKKTVEALRDYGVTTIIDMRIFTELEEKPDTAIEGIEYRHIPLLCTATAGITHEKTMRKTYSIEAKRIKAEFGSIDNYMFETYKSILINGESVEGLKEIFNLISQNDGCILWHCSGGKDRAGIIAMLLLTLLGVDEKIIVQDFAASQRFLRHDYFWKKLGLCIIPVSRHFRGILFAMMNAKPRYIVRLMDFLKDEYGSVQGYCQSVLGITPEEIENLKDKYLE